MKLANALMDLPFMFIPSDTCPLRCNYGGFKAKCNDDYDVYFVQF
jgi:hypothetical protein